MDVGALLESVKLKSVEIAALLGVSESHVSDLKKGRRRLTVEHAGTLENATGLAFVAAVVRERTSKAPASA